MEIWKDVKGYEGKYQVSNLGKVRSLDWRGSGTVKELTLKDQNRGYVQVNLGARTFSVHRLVAEAFIPNPQGLPLIDHLDEDKTNNKADNLEWCDHKENTRRWMVNHPGVLNAPRHSRKRRTPHKNQGAILQIALDGTEVRKWENAVSVRQEMGWSDWSIIECCRGNRKTAYGYKWQFATEA